MTQAKIMEAESAEDYADGKVLIEEYAAALGVDLCFQNFSEEIADLGKMYGPPRGCLLLARNNRELAGCVAPFRGFGTEYVRMLIPLAYAPGYTPRPRSGPAPSGRAEPRPGRHDVARWRRRAPIAPSGLPGQALSLNGASARSHRSHHARAPQTKVVVKNNNMF